MGYNPKKEPSVYPKDYKGTVAVVDGTNMLTCHDEKNVIWAEINGLPTDRPRPRYEILVLWLDQMKSRSIFRSYLVVIRCLYGNGCRPYFRHQPHHCSVTLLRRPYYCNGRP